MKPIYSSGRVVILLILFLLPVHAFGQISIPGLSGIQLNTADENYSLNITHSFSYKAVEFEPGNEGFTLSFDAATTTFSFWGAGTMNAGSHAFEITLGSEAEPGLQFAGTQLAGFSASVSSEFSISGLDFEPTDVGVSFSTSDDAYHFHGSLSTTVAEQHIQLVFADPGIVIGGGTLQQFKAGVTSDLHFYGSNFTTKDLALEYIPASNYFHISGEAEFDFAGHSVDASFNAPGIAISNGEITTFAFALQGDIVFEGLKIHSKGLLGEYSKANAEYIFGGIVDVELDGNKVEAKVGRQNAAGVFTYHGIVINKGVVDRLELYLTGGIHLSQISLDSHDLMVAYYKQDNTFEMSGNAKAVFNDFSLDLSVGTAASPGVKIVNGVIQDFELKVAATPFTVGGVTITPHSLEFDYHHANSHFQIYGGATMHIEGHDWTVQLGNAQNPGLDIINKDLHALNGSITGSFSLKGLDVTANGLGFSYTHSGSNSLYKVYGSAGMKIKDDHLDIKFGADVNHAGLVITNGTIETIDIQITTDFQMKGVKFQANGLGFAYMHQAANANTFHIYGASKITFDNEVIAVKLGTKTDPGLIIYGGQVHHLEMEVDTHLQVRGLSFDAHPLKIVYSDLPNGAHKLAISGNASLNFESEKMSVTFGGDTSKEGIVIVNGHIQAIDLIIGSHIKVGSIVMENKHVELTYLDQPKEWTLSGEVVVDLNEHIELDVIIGKDNRPGIVIKTGGPKPVVDVKSLIIDVHNVNLGAFNILTGEVDITDNAFSGAKLDVLFPGGIEVKGSMDFDSHSKLKSIMIDFTATTPEDAIPMPGGGFIVELKGALDNLDEPLENVVFTGKVGIAYGGPMNLAGQEITLLYAQSDAVISHTGFKITQNLMVGAHKSGDTWHSVFAEATGHIEMVFGSHFKMDASMYFPSQPHEMVYFGTELYIDASHIAALIELKLIVPEDIPFIGGETLLHAEGAIMYYNKNLNASYVAGWTDWDVFGKQVVIGAKYNMGTRHISKIGHDDVDGITSTVNIVSREGDMWVDLAAYTTKVTSSEPLPQAIIYTMEFPNNNNSKYQQVAQFSTPEDDEYEFYWMTKYDPFGLYSSLKFHQFEGYWLVPMGYSLLSTGGFPGTHKFLVIDKAVMAGMKNVWAFKPWESYLVPGNYYLKFGTPPGHVTTAINPKHAKYTAKKFYMPPQIKIEDVKIDPTDNHYLLSTLTYYSVNIPHTKINLYAREVSSGQVTLLEESIPYTHLVENGHLTGVGQNKSHRVRLDQLIPDTNYEFYAIIDDAINAVAKSNSSQAIYMSPSIGGTLNCWTCNVTSPYNPTQKSNPLNLNGIVVYLDVNNNGRYDAGEPKARTVRSGDQTAIFSFGWLHAGTYRVGVIAPNGYELYDGTNTIKLENGHWKAWTYNKTQLNLNINIRKK